MSMEKRKKKNRNKNNIEHIKNEHTYKELINFIFNFQTEFFRTIFAIREGKQKSTTQTDSWVFYGRRLFGAIFFSSLSPSSSFSVWVRCIFMVSIRNRFKKSDHNGGCTCSLSLLFFPFSFLLLLLS